MEHGPLPTHERSWRHPSEVAAEERRAVQTEPGPSSLRTVALTGGTLGLLAIGLAVLTLTPDRLDAPVRLAAPATLDDLTSSVTTLAAIVSATPQVPAPTHALLGPELGGAPALGDVRPPMVQASDSPSASTTRASTTAVSTTWASTTSSSPVGGRTADPIGSTGYAIVTVDPDDSRRPARHSTVAVRLPTGDLRTALTVASNDLVTLVAIDPAAGSRLARHLPDATDMVTVTSDHDTLETTYADLVADPDPPAAAVITDADGAVVGVCADHDGTLVYQPLVAAPGERISVPGVERP